MKINAVLAYCTLYYFQYFLQSILELPLIYLIYYKYINHNKENVSKYDYVYQRKKY